MTPDIGDIRHAAHLLEAGKLVAFPTETVYGLGADASNPDAIAAIFAAKGRPSNHPLIVHVARGADLGRWTSRLPVEAITLTTAFWPGPLTMILPRAAGVPAAVAGGQDSIGLRCPSHPIARTLLAEFRGGQGGIAGPSANRFGRVSPTTAQHVIDEFGLPGAGPLAAVLDGGPSDVGIESTIVDLTRLETLGPVLLRPGQISATQIAEVLGRMPSLPDAAAPRVSGSLNAHYAPRTPLVLARAEEFDWLMRQLDRAERRYALMHRSALGTSGKGLIAAEMMPVGADAYAHQLYASLRKMDAAGADLIIVEGPPVEDAWQGIHDRLRRAAFDSAGILERLSAS
jgi:L-threonylcarbamoyladenylate synthase